MGRRRFRTKSGRLGVRERRRRLRKANLQPGQHILLDVSRRSRKGKRLRNGFRIDFVVKKQWSIDIDVRKLLHAIRINLAKHYSDSLKNNQRPDGSGALPRRVKDQRTESVVGNDGTTTRVTTSRNLPGHYGFRTGWMANNWKIGAIRGGPFRATCRLSPNGADGRDGMIRAALRDGVDFQSVTDAAAKVIDDTIIGWLRVSVPAGGDGVATPSRVVTHAGVLSAFRAGEQVE